jgi:UTP-glucose-1-phosphate uridylyltransferase
MQKPTLLILAAGMGSRYGGIKQMDSFGPNGETLIDYSIYDAIRAGFGKIVFIIREDFASEFEKIFDNKLKDHPDVEIQYIYQEADSYLGDYKLPADRRKPWGTAHAVLCAKDAIKEPFAVINADDFYGQESFNLMGEFLQTECSAKRYAVMGYELEKTLSKHGSVSRGVCKLDNHGNLDTITERTKIYRKNGHIVYQDAGKEHVLAPETPVSMNFWGFHPDIFALLEKRFQHFLSENLTRAKAEFLIPSVVDDYIGNNAGTVKVIPTGVQWFGVTYRDDAPAVKKSLKQLICNDVYPEKLWTK